MVRNRESSEQERLMNMAREQYKKFIEGGTRYEDFTNLVYDYIRLNCKYKDKHPHTVKKFFYALYFLDAVSKKRFLAQFEPEKGCQACIKDEDLDAVKHTQGLYNSGGELAAILNSVGVVEDE